MTNAMRNALFILLLSARLGVPVLAQDAPFKRWGSGPLVWEDFRRSQRTDSTNGQLYFFYNPEKEKYHLGDTVVKRVVLRTYSDRERSWQDSTLHSQSELAYFQLLFDLAEMEQRLQQPSVDRCGKMKCIGELRDSAMAHMSRNVRELERLAMLEDQAALTDLISGYRSRIQATGMDTRPHVQGAACAIGLSVGTGKVLLPTEIDAEMHTSALLSIGFSFAYRKLTFLFSFDAAKVKPSAGTEGLTPWISGEEPSLGQVQASLGYSLRVQRNLRLIPYAGLGYFGVGSGKNEAYTSLELRRPVAGVSVFRPLHKALKLLPGSREYVEGGLFADLRFAPLDLDAVGSGPTLTVLIGGSFTANWLKPH